MLKLRIGYSLSFAPVMMVVLLSGCGGTQEEQLVLRDETIVGERIIPGDGSVSATTTAATPKRGSGGQKSVPPAKR